MALHPQAAQILDLVKIAGRPEYWQLGPQVARVNHDKGGAALDIEPVQLAKVWDVHFEARDARLRMRLYRPEAARSPHGALLWLHGGGHVVGSIEGYDALCRTLAKSSGALVASLDYRLAPEHKFPAAVDDALDALQWLHQNAPALDFSPAKLAVGGDSAGGNLAAVTAISARDRGGPQLRLQLLAYPAVGAWPDTQSHQKYGEGHLLTRNNVDWFQDCYVRSPEDRMDWRFAPLLCPDLSDLAPAVLVLAECDPLHDEGMAFATRLRAQGNRVEVYDYAGMIHAFLNMGGWLDDSRHAIERCATAVREAMT